MTKASEIIEEAMENPSARGCLVSSLRSAAIVEQRHRDKLNLDVFWRETGGGWRCTVFREPGSELCLAQIDLQSRSVRVEVFEPCNVVIDEDDGLLCIIRYDPGQL
jgi:hypothetical protein